ncbi:teicoplanin resistance protein VanZ [Staphylococcus coagulans]|uniref:Membrane-associated protein TcaA n=3 Tax=Staphylococcus coagulans TaxID=74706 RepID=A0ABU1F0L7_9STAP|nr:teicoplanin resistance protein VanZ [Staphylococcus coagulans]
MGQSNSFDKSIVKILIRRNRGENMSWCPVCEEETIDQKNICRHCGSQVSYSKEPTPSLSRQTKGNSTPPHKNRLPLKTVIPIAIVTFILILLMILFLLLRNFNSPEAQAKILINAVNNDDVAKVSNILSSKDNKVGRKEAATYIKYIKDEIGMKKFEKDVFHTVDSLNHETAVASYIKTKKGQDVLRISKNGRRYLIFDNIGFKAPTKQAVIKSNEKATFEFESDGLKKKIITEKGQSVALGNYIPGRYAVDAVKTTDRGTYEGQLKFDFDQSNNETIPVTEDFEEAKIKVKLKNTEGLNKKDLMIVINGEKIKPRSDETYKSFPLNKDIVIYAEGQSYDQKFKTNEKVIKKSDIQSENEVELSFDKDEIKKFNASKQKNTFDKVSEFIKKYTGALNKAYEKSDFAEISSYLLKDTSNYEVMKEKINGRARYHFTNPKVTNVSKNNDFYSVLVEKENEQGQIIQSHYLIDGDSDGEHLKIVNYEDY